MSKQFVDICGKKYTVENKGEVLICQTPDSRIELRVQLDKETVWLSQVQMTTLFERDRTVITKHIGNIFEEGELDEKSNVHFLHFANSDKPVALHLLPFPRFQFYILRV